MARPTAKPFFTHPKSKLRKGARGIKTPLNVVVSKDQKSFRAAGVEMAKAFGWYGEDTDRLNDITVKDAQNYFTKVFHECHIAAINGKPLPVAEEILEHMGLDVGEYAEEDLQTLVEKIAELSSAEKAEFDSK